MADSISGAHGIGMRSGAAERPYNAPEDMPNSKLNLWAGESFEFADLLDFVNPLQHLPGISYLYRELTGDKIGALARVVGGGILGGPVGAATSLANAIIEAETGDDIGGHAIAFLTGDSEFPDSDGSSDGPTQFASMSGRGRDPLFDQPPASGIESQPAAPDSDLAARETAPATQSAAVASTAQPFARSMSERGDDPLWQDASYAPALAAAPAPPAASVQTVDSKRRGASFDVATGQPAMLAASFSETADVAAPSSAPDADDREPGPWIADAMSTALDKYQEMARLRTSEGLSIDAAY